MMQIPLFNSQTSSGNGKKQYDFTYKIILLGATCTGKTSILKRYVNNSSSSTSPLYVLVAYLHVQCLCY